MSEWTDDASFLAEVTARCDAATPLEWGDELYVAFDELTDGEGHPIRGDDVARKMASHVELCTSGAATQLLAGFRGSGKSTELRRFKHFLEEAGYDVMLCRAEHYVNLTTPVQITDFLLSLALALDDEAQKLVPDAPTPKPSLTTRIKNYFQKRPIQIDGFDVTLDAKIVKATLKGSLQKNPTFRAKMHEHLKGLIYEFHQEFEQYVIEIVAWIRDNRATRKGLVFVMDGVDHVRGISDERHTVQESIESLFGQFSEMLKLPSIHAVYTVPTYLPFLNPALRDLYGMDSIRMLPMPKQHRREPTRPDHPEGMAALTNFLERRIQDPERLLGADWHARLTDIARDSGGYLRDMLSVVRGVVETAHSKKTLPAPQPFVDAARVRQKNDYLRVVTPEDAAALSTVAKTFSIDQISAEYRPRLAELFETHVTLCYANGAEWYDVHPLVHDRITASETATADEAAGETTHER